MRLLPPGNSSELLKPRTWQPVPGSPDTYIFAEIRKADVISSNSYLIRTPVCFLLIDPGGLSAQAEIIASEIHLTGADDLPVVVILTHAHVDHFTGMQANGLFCDQDRCILVVQETGARAIEQHDRELTQAELLGRDFTAMVVGIHLFSGNTFPNNVPTEEITLPGQVRVSRTRDRPLLRDEQSIDRETFTFHGGDCIELFHTPGHSGDSICIRLGRLLFIGDLLFAANPGIAGLKGWDQAALIDTLERMLVLLRAGIADIVCPGHGRIISAQNACTMLEHVLTDARALTNIAELNSQRAEETARFAEDCMEEINELFTIIAGRLYYVSHVMDELGETEIAAHACTLLKADELDSLLDSFREFAEAHHAHDHVSIHLALKAGQVIGKLERSFMKSELETVIDLSLVQRAERLLLSYSSMLRGFTPPQEREACRLCPAIESLIIGLTEPSYSDDDILDSTDDTEAFCRLLLARIGTRPILKDVRVSFDHDSVDPFVLIDKALFFDLLTYLLEDLVGTGSDTVKISIAAETTRAALTITGIGRDTANTPAGTVRGFYIGLCERAGGVLSGEIVPGGRTYTIALTPAV